MEKIKSRSAYWDNMKGMLIWLVVFAHMLYQFQERTPLLNGITDIIYMFHMPAFVFVSGYFGKSESSRSASAIAKFIFLYFIFNSITGFIFGFGSLTEPLYSYWYIPALIVWRLTAHHIAKFKEIDLILLVTAVFAGFFDSIDNTFAAARIIAFYPYYMAGYKLSEEKSGVTVRTDPAKRFFKGAAILAADMLLAAAAYNYFEYTDNALLMSNYNYPKDAFGRIVLYIIAFTAIYALRNISPDKNIPLLSMFGRNSLWIYLFHRPFTLWISPLMVRNSSNGIIIISVFAAFAMCMIFGSDKFAGLLGKFAESGTKLLLGKETKKFTFAKLAALLVALGFVVSVVGKAYADVEIEDIKKFFNGESVTENIDADAV